MLWSVYMFCVTTALSLRGIYLFLLVVSCILGDYLVSFVGAEYVWTKCAIDSFTHAFIACLSCAIVLRFQIRPFDWSKAKACVVSMVMGSVLDVDHFIQAGSLELKVLNFFI